MDLQRNFAIPQELATFLQKIKDFQNVHTPRLNIQQAEARAIPEDESAELPGNINLFHFSRFVRENFRNPGQWGMLSNPLQHSITKTVPDQDAKTAATLNRMILRCTMDKNLKGADLKLFSDYIVNMILLNHRMRDEALVQIASLTWNNYDDDHKGRLWVLLSHCLSCTMPSPQLYSFLLKYVSDHGIGCYPALLQQKLLRMPQNLSISESRFYPPCVLEWQSHSKCSTLAIWIYLPDDSVQLVEANSWTTAEEIANRALESRLGVSVQGWSLVLENENRHSFELSGHDYVFDLFSYMELFPELETPPHEFLTYQSGAHGNASFDPSEFLRIESSGMVDTLELSRRIKGGGRMMQQPMGMGGMMMQPQMMPMMQQPQMMMQPSTMPMQNMQMMQPMMQPMMPSQMMPSQMSMPLQQQMVMPSIGMMSTAMDPAGQQQAFMQQQMQMLLKQQQEQDKKMDKILKISMNEEHSSDSDEERRRPKRNEKKYRRHFSSEDGRRSRRHRERHSSGEGSPQRRRDFERHGAAVASTALTHKNHSERLHYKEPRNQPKSPREEDVPKIRNNGQDTSKSSFHANKSFFQNKEKGESLPLPRRQPPKSLDLFKKETPKHCSDEESLEREPQVPVRQNSWKTSQPSILNEEGTHEQALRLALAAAKKNQVQRSESEALLSRQRREAAKKQNGIPSPEPPKNTSMASEPPMNQASTSLSSPRDSLKSGDALTAALAARQQARNQQMHQQLEQRQHPPPLPPALDIPEASPTMPTDDATRTVLHSLRSQAPLTYVNVKWRMRVRKEVFHAGEHIKNLEMEKMLLPQIAREAQNGNPRILPADRDDIKVRLASSATKKMEVSAVRSLLRTCQENWTIYFTQIFRIKVREIDHQLPRGLYDANAIGVGQTGIHFITMNGDTEWKTKTFDFDFVSQVKVKHDVFLDFFIQGKGLSLYCRKSSQLKKVILPYLVSPPPRPRTSAPSAPTQEHEVAQDAMSLRKQEPHQDVYDVLPAPVGTQFSLLMYARQCFRKPKEAEKALQHSKTALNKTLLDFGDFGEKAAVALQCFRYIQQFMGDAPTKAISVETTVYRLLGTCKKHVCDILLDEVYVYFAKQLNSNKRSRNRVLGWRLFSLFVTYFQCSKILMPHLLAHLHEYSNGEDRTNSVSANVCLINLQQIVTYGGRQQMPSDEEVKALMNGYATFEQSFSIPGWTHAKFKITTSTVFMEAVSYFCAQLGITDTNEVKEYGVFSVIIGQDNQMLDILPQKRNVYILDFMSDMIRKKNQFLLSFQRVVWKKQINYDNENLVLMLFNQVVSEYVDGKFLTFREMTEGFTKAQLSETAKLGALVHRGLGHSSLPTLEEAKCIIPRKTLIHQSEYVWKEQAQNQFTSIQNISPHEARSEVLALLTNKKMFGASFFTVQMAGADNPMKMKMIAIDAEKVCIFDLENHLIDAEHDLSSVVDVGIRTDTAANFPVCEITIQTESGVSQISLKTNKARLIAGILNHHIHVVHK